MFGYLTLYAVGNSCLSLGLAGVAWSVQRSGRSPQAAHGLWLLVIALLVAPPVIFLPLGGLLNGAAGEFGTLASELAYASGVMAPLSAQAEQAVSATAGNGFHISPATDYRHAIVGALMLAWGLGSATVLGWLLLQVQRFNRTLRLARFDAAPVLQREAAAVARRLGLKSPPEVHLTTARISPMVWSGRWRPCVLLPAGLMEGLEAHQVRWVLAHELAHLRRGDHLVRWLECLGCVLFWWNPVVWWARGNLRLNEEILCDALVLHTFAPARRAYAETLVAAAETLAAPSSRFNPVASAMNSGGFLERRLHMIMSKRLRSKPSRRLRVTLLAVCLLLPLGFSSAEEHDAVSAGMSPTIGTSALGDWHASSRTAVTTTGDIKVTPTGITFANGKEIPIRPATPGGQNVFAVTLETDPAVLGDGGHCQRSITYVMLLPYADFALAMHVYDDSLPPEAPSAANLSQLARQGRCASYYYRRNS